MADIIWTDVTKLVASLATGVDADVQAMILGFVNERVNPTIFGGDASPTYKFARVALAAHFGEMTKAGTFGFLGQKSSQSEGGVSVSFSTPTAQDPFLETTVGGRLWKYFVRVSPATLGFTA